MGTHRPSAPHAVRSPLREWGIPVARPRRAVSVPSPAAEPTASGARVLVVEDDPDTRRALLLALADDLDESIAPAADGEEALWIAAASPPDVVLLDIGLPKRDGYDVVRQLRADPRTAGAWVIALTGTGSALEAALAGFDQFLPKPVDLDQVAVAVQGGLARSDRAAAAAAADPEVDRRTLREIELLAERLGPLAEEVADGTEADLADVFERIERQLRN